MLIKINNFNNNPINILRAAGYVFQKKEGDELAFVRPLSRSGFPRFHLFASMRGGDLIIKLHLDQKKVTYGKASRHHGQYTLDNRLVEESQRIKEIIYQQMK